MVLAAAAAAAAVLNNICRRRRRGAAVVAGNRTYIQSLPLLRLLPPPLEHEQAEVELQAAVPQAV